MTCRVSGRKRFVQRSKGSSEELDRGQRNQNHSPDRVPELRSSSDPRPADPLVRLAADHHPRIRACHNLSNSVHKGQTGDSVNVRSMERFLLLCLNVHVARDRAETNTCKLAIDHRFEKAGMLRSVKKSMNSRALSCTTAVGSLPGSVSGCCCSAPFFANSSARSFQWSPVWLSVLCQVTVTGHSDAI